MEAIAAVEACGLARLDEDQKDVAMVAGHLLVHRDAECRSPRSEPRPSSGRGGGDWFRSSRDAPPFHRRLPLGYSRAGDARPGRHPLGSGCCASGDRSNRIEIG